MQTAATIGINEGLVRVWRKGPLPWEKKVRRGQGT